jgi:hypothetical protein
LAFWWLARSAATAERSFCRCGRTVGMSTKVLVDPRLLRQAVILIVVEVGRSAKFRLAHLKKVFEVKPQRIGDMLGGIFDEAMPIGAKRIHPLPDPAAFWAV